MYERGLPTQGPPIQMAAKNGPRQNAEIGRCRHAKIGAHLGVDRLSVSVEMAEGLIMARGQTASSRELPHHPTVSAFLPMRQAATVRIDWCGWLVSHVWVYTVFG